MTGSRRPPIPARTDRRIRHPIEYVLFRALLAVLSRLSWNRTRRLGRILGSIAFDLVRVRRRVTLENLAAAFPEWDRARRLSVARDCYRHFAITFLELCLLTRATAADLRERVRFEDPGIFDRALAEGRGAVLLTGHFGNWEVIGSGLAAFGYPVSVLVKPQRNRRVDAHITRARQSGGMRVLTTDQGLRPILRRLRENGFVAFLADQDAGRDGIFVQFLGRAASTPLGPVRFARRAGTPIVFGFGVREPDGRYRVEMPDPIRVREDLAAEDAEREATQICVAHLEDRIRRYPSQWFWMHRRWKTRPIAEPRRRA